MMMAHDADAIHIQDIQIKLPAYHLASFSVGFEK